MCSTQEGSPPFFFDWAKNAKTIKSSPDFNFKIENFETFSTLSIKKLERFDSANYTCTVKNTVGSDTQHFLLNVKGKEQSRLQFSYWIRLTLFYSGSFSFVICKQLYSFCWKKLLVKCFKSTVRRLLQRFHCNSYLSAKW